VSKQNETEEQRQEKREWMKEKLNQIPKLAEHHKRDVAYFDEAVCIRDVYTGEMDLDEAKDLLSDLEGYGQHCSAGIEGCCLSSSVLPDAPRGSLIVTYANNIFGGSTVKTAISKLDGREKNDMLLSLKRIVFENVGMRQKYELQCQQSKSSYFFEKFGDSNLPTSIDMMLDCLDMRPDGKSRRGEHVRNIQVDGFFDCTHDVNDQKYWNDIDDIIFSSFDYRQGLEEVFHDKTSPCGSAWGR
jgi:hypothetical protein